MNHKTLKSDVLFEGLGLHSGEPVRVRVMPGGDGIIFRHGSETLRAVAENVLESARCTRLGSISTIEHLMSALAALGITDVVAEVEGGELPALDGAAGIYCEGLLDAGIEEGRPLEVEAPFKRVFLVEQDIKIAISAGEGVWSYQFHSGDRWPHEQEVTFDFRTDEYCRDIAPARTFAFEEQVPQIRAAGLARGLDLDTALILGSQGYINEPRLPDEPVRHKLLDLMGDLALAGLPLSRMNVTAERSGHKTNVAAALKLRQTLGLAVVM